MMTIEEAIEHCEEKTDCTECGLEHWQLGNWLKTLKEYIEKDIPKQVTQGCLTGKCICPRCGERMALGVKNYCDICGQAIRLN